jgi:hypothetical protein
VTIKQRNTLQTTEIIESSKVGEPETRHKNVQEKKGGQFKEQRFLRYPLATRSFFDLTEKSWFALVLLLTSSLK